jgi:BTB/POZ domain/MATH domain
VSFFLELQRESTDITTNIGFALLDKHGILSTASLKEFSHSFVYPQSAFGWPRLLERTKLEKEYVKDGYFTLNVTITLKGKSCTGACHFPHALLQKFQKQNKGVDVTFNVDFITISEMMPSVWKAMLDVMYNGSLLIDDEINDSKEPMSSISFLQHLLAAADRYAVKNLKDICEHKLVKSISLKTVLMLVCFCFFWITSRLFYLLH